MAQIVSNSLKEIDFKKLKNEKLSEIFVAFGDEFVSLDKLEIITKSQKSGSYTLVESSRPIKNLSDFKSNYSKLCLRDKSGLYVETFNKPKLYYKGFIVPSTWESINIDKTGAIKAEKIPYGLKRKLTVEASIPTKDANAYLYVEVGGEWKFVKQSDIVWFDGTEKKTYIQALNEKKDLSTIKFFDDKNKEISRIYTEYEYKFSRVVEKEVFDVKNRTKSLVSINEEGKEIELAKHHITSTYSEQKFVQVEVDDEKNPGKKKVVSKVKAKNYTVVGTDKASLNDKNLYVNLTVSDAIKTHSVMVKIANLVDEEGNEISDLSMMFGKRVKIKDGDKIIATSDPLTYEQANLRFDSTKTYQEIDGLPNENSCLRLEDGTYVEELDSVQPMSYKVAVGDDFDKYLVEQLNGGEKRYVIVDKDYFAKHGKTKDLNMEKAVKLQRCDMNDANCSVIQTTSKEDEIEQSAIIGDIKIDGVSLPKSTKTKKELYEAFKTGYKNGEYKINDVYHNGKFNKIQTTGKRYQYTDEVYYDDYANNLTEYQALKSKNIIIKDGKMQGGSEYDVLEGIRNGFSKWHEILKKGFGFAVAAGLFLPVIGTIAAAVYGVGMIIAVPAIPIVNVVRGAVLNRTKNYVDKTVYNRTKETININKKISSLLEIHGSLNEKQFEDVYSRLLNDVLSLSATTSVSALEIKDGKAKVDSNNVRIADEYIREYNYIQQKLKVCSSKIEKLKEKGKPIPAELQEEYDRLLEKQANLNNSQVGNSYGEHTRMQSLYFKVVSLKFYHKATTLKDKAIKTFLTEVGLGASFDITRLSYDLNKGLTLDGLALSSSEKELNNKFKSDATKTEAWIKLRNVIILGCNKLETIEVEKPVSVGVGDSITEEVVEPTVAEDKKTIEEEVATKVEESKTKEPKKKSEGVKFDTKINSEDELVVILKSRPESKDRKKLIQYIKSKSGVDITEEDIQETIDRINEKHLEGKNATSNASRLKNKNVEVILTYGQQYLTLYAREIKERTIPHSV